MDSSGKAYVGGVTTSIPDFPVLNPFQATAGNGVANFESTGFVAGLAADGTLELFDVSRRAQRRGHHDNSGVYSPNPAGDAYVVGNTNSQNFPTVNPLQAVNNSISQGTNVVVAEFNPQGQPVYSTYLGGNENDLGNAIVADTTVAGTSGNAYITGQQRRFSIQLSGSTYCSPFQATLNGSDDVFVTKLNFNVSSSTLTLAASTFLGGSSTEEGWGIAIDTALTAQRVCNRMDGPRPGKRVRLVFRRKVPFSGTYSGVPYSGATNAGGSDAFVTLKSKGILEALVYSTLPWGNKLRLWLWYRSRWGESTERLCDWLHKQWLISTAQPTAGALYLLHFIRLRFGSQRRQATLYSTPRC